MAAFGPNAPAPVGLIRIVDLATSEVLAELDHLQRVIASAKDTAEQNALGQEQLSDIAQIVFSPDDHYLIGVRFQGAVGVWETEDWRLVDSLPAETGATSAVVNGSGDEIIVQTSAGLLQRRGLPGLGALGEPMVASAGTAVGLIEHPLAFTPGERQLAVGQNNGAQLWDLGDGQPADRATVSRRRARLGLAFVRRPVRRDRRWRLRADLESEHRRVVRHRLSGRRPQPDCRRMEAVRASGRAL